MSNDLGIEPDLNENCLIGKKELDKKVLLIVNPISGTLSKDGLEDRVRERLAEVGCEVECVFTERPGHGRELAAEAAAKEYFAVIAAGGDGTINEVGCALAGSKTALGILPFGSGNGLARHMYGSINLKRTLDIIAKGFVTDCDYGTVNGKPFFCTFGLGFDAKVSSEFAHLSRRGLISYARSAVVEYAGYSPGEYVVLTDKKCFKTKAFILAVCNASQYGNNAYIAPNASVHDGLLDVTLIKSGNIFSRAFAAVELFTGRLNRNILIRTMKASHLTIKHLPGPGHIDGDPCMMPETIEVVCHKGGIKMFTDPDKPSFKPFITPALSIKSDSDYLFGESMRKIGSRLPHLFKARCKKAKND